MVVNDKVTMWSVQSEIVLDTLNSTGEYYVKKKYIDEKYKDVAWIFKEAYSFFSKEFSKSVKKPDDAEIPVWMFLDRKWAKAENNALTLKLSIPKNELILFDMRKWSKILNLSFIGDEDEEQLFLSNLKKQGIEDTTVLFSKPYYPIQKRQVTDTWKKIFEIDDINELYIQSATWLLKKDWIEEVV